MALLVPQIPVQTLVHTRSSHDSKTFLILLSDLSLLNPLSSLLSALPLPFLNLYGLSDYFCTYPYPYHYRYY